MKYAYFLGIIFFILGCSNTIDKKLHPTLKLSKPILQDLITIPQNIQTYTGFMEDKLHMVSKNYEEAYFSVWNMQKPKETLKDIQWPFVYFKHTSSYGENLLPIKQAFFDSMHAQSNFDEYLKTSTKGLILNYTNIRALPTSRPLLRDPSLAGEGFPFDYLQNSSINANTPVFISHYSKDKQWVFIFSRFTYGWVNDEDVVTIEDKHTVFWKNARQVHIVKEGIPLFTQDNVALYNTRIGMMFALIKEDPLDYTVLSVGKYKNNEAVYYQTKISKKYARKNILALSQKNLNMIINEVSQTNYGWGGVYGQRDCSSMLMDLYAPFGIALPRNSSKQAKVGLIIDLSKKSNQEKLNTIKNEAIPFETLIYKKGHIVLYVGVYKGDVIVFHNTWGIKIKDSKKEGRFLIGKPIFSTLTIGSELKNYDEDAELLRNIKSMNILTR